MNRHSPDSLSRRTLLRSAALVPLTGFHARTANAVSASRQATPSSHPERSDLLTTFNPFAQHVEARMAELGIPGVAFGVVRSGSRTTCTSGVTNILSGELVDANTMFRVGSLSQLFTGSAITSLVDEGILDLDSPVRSYLPTFRVGDTDATEAVTIRHLVTHTAGWHGTLAFDPGPGDDALARYVERMEGLPQVAPPGAHFSYGATAGILEGHLVAELTGLPFETAIKDLVLSPLSMNHSSYFASDVAGESLAFGHAADGNSLSVIDPFAMSRAAAPVTGMFSSVDELMAFVSFHANAPVGRAPTYLTAPARDMAHSPLGPGGSIGPLVIDAMGLNWMIVDFDGTPVSVHAGHDAGQTSMLAVVPSHAFGVVVLTNADHGTGFALEMVLDALDRFLGLRLPQREEIEVDEHDLQAFAGTYRFIDGPTLEVTRSADGLRLETFDAEARVEDQSGDLRFVGPSLAELQHGESTLLVDFVRDDDGEVSWIRHLGQLAARDPQ